MKNNQNKIHIMNKTIKNTLDIINTTCSKDIVPKLYTPLKVGDTVVVFGICHSIIMYGQYSRFITEIEGEWIISNTKGIDTPSGWLRDIEKVSMVARQYLLDYGRAFYYDDSNIICGYGIKCDDIVGVEELIDNIIDISDKHYGGETEITTQDN